ncbi:hypothetical protein MUY14_24280 [Amycolatopsis sp. FBCC-B4732]|uniref:hypothetical protein n=1 Tax=Amycolatopsis sp. FBCC-B4732 TaxID=3079339 RepID=UPI001FF40948|nr:hypothetical protein [Amycolatopsis sp. FBCC-B4732]UOX84930.1 hypothetical protein MUY14_24280 [Amycolatopsis sp. FBCC-B4732]
MHLVVHADQRQFSLRDSGSTLTGSGWTPEALDHRIAAEPGGIAIVTARSDVVESSVTLCPSAPSVVAEAEHVVEADLPVASGKLVISGPADYPWQEKFFSVLPGLYRARVSYVPAGPPSVTWNEHEFGEHYRYVVELWPVSSASGVEVLRQGASVWDG